MINPNQLINQMMSNPQYANNPRAKKVFEALKNKDHQALVDLGENIFRENGTNLKDATDKFMRNNRF